jgi:hypothetical protein
VSALVRAENPNLTDDQVRQLILNAVDPLGRAPARTRSNGALNGFRALFRAAGPLALRKYAALAEFFVDELQAATSRAVNWAIDTLMEILGNAPYGSNFTPEIHERCIWELAALRDLEDVTEENIPYTLAALEALRADAEEVPVLGHGDWQSGRIGGPREVDTFSFFGTAGQIVIINVDAQVLGWPWDPVLRVFGPDGNEILMSDDYDSRDPWLEFTLPDSGEYTFSVEDYGRDDGGDEFAYEVSLGSGLFPASEADPHFTQRWEGTIDARGEWDEFQFEARAGDIAIVNVDARVNQSDLDSEVRLYGPRGEILATNDDDDFRDSRLEIALPDDGPYTVAVGEHGDDRYGEDCWYIVWVELFRP